MLRSLRRTTRAFTGLVRPDLAAALARQSITAPTSIQREALPLAMAGADVLVNASTGSGKTLIFLLPLLQRLLEQSFAQQCSWRFEHITHALSLPEAGSGKGQQHQRDKQLRQQQHGAKGGAVSFLGLRFVRAGQAKRKKSAGGGFSPRG